MTGRLVRTKEFVIIGDFEAAYNFLRKERKSANTK